MREKKRVRLESEAVHALARKAEALGVDEMKALGRVLKARIAAMPKTKRPRRVTAEQVKILNLWNARFAFDRAERERRAEALDFNGNEENGTTAWEALARVVRRYRARARRTLP